MSGSHHGDGAEDPEGAAKVTQRAAREPHEAGNSARDAARPRGPSGGQRAGRPGSRAAGASGPARGGRAGDRDPARPAARRNDARADAEGADRGSPHRVAELVAAGIPLPLAQQVAGGRMALNEALERMAKRAEVENLMRRHDLSRALATQVVLGHADLDAFLLRRRRETHLEAHRDRSCLTEARDPAHPWVFSLHGQRRVSGHVLDVTPYEAVLHTEEEGRLEVHKLQLKLAWPAEDWKKNRKAMRTDKALSAAPREPVVRPQDRFSVSDRRLFRFLDEATELDVTTLEGDVVRGALAWVGRFEVELTTRGGGRVVVFRHALAGLTAAR